MSAHAILLEKPISEACISDQRHANLKFLLSYAAQQHESWRDSIIMALQPSRYSALSSHLHIHPDLQRCTSLLLHLSRKLKHVKHLL